MHGLDHVHVYAVQDDVLEHAHVVAQGLPVQMCEVVFLDVVALEQVKVVVLGVLLLIVELCHATACRLCHRVRPAIQTGWVTQHLMGNGDISLWNHLRGSIESAAVDKRLLDSGVVHVLVVESGRLLTTNWKFLKLRREKPSVLIRAASRLVLLAVEHVRAEVERVVLLQRTELHWHQLTHHVQRVPRKRLIHHHRALSVLLAPIQWRPSRKASVLR